MRSTAAIAVARCYHRGVMPLRVALIGAGNIASVHIAALTRAENAELAGVYDQNGDLARQRAESHAIPKVYATWEALLGDADIDCVAVLLPHDLHERYAIEALAAGKHVVCEKPLGTDVAECDRMLAAAARAGRRLFPVHNRVYDWAAERMGEIVREGKIGEIVLAQTNGYEGPRTVGVRPWLATKAGGGGVLMAQAVHPAYVLRWLLGDVARVGCLFGDVRVVDMTAEDTAVATLKFASGVLAEMTATFGIAHGPFDHTIQLHGRDGYLHLGSGRRGGNPYVLSAIAPQLYGDNELREVEVAPSDGFQTGFYRMWVDYAAAILDGTPPRVTGEDGKKAVEIVEAAYRSNELGRVVDLPLSG
jgi:UDP-N-acetyl-2-amino-2-deoxyglucuronate dehydrogenase